jgi:hypothetical protein
VPLRLPAAITELFRCRGCPLFSNRRLHRGIRRGALFRCPRPQRKSLSKIRGRMPLSARSWARSNALSQRLLLAFPSHTDIAVSETSNSPCFGQWMTSNSPVRGNSRCAPVPQIGHIVVAMNEIPPRSSPPVIAGSPRPPQPAPQRAPNPLRPQHTCP